MRIIYDLRDRFFDQQDAWLPIVPPEPRFILRQSGFPTVLPFDWENFPGNFVKNLTWQYENTVTVFPITILEAPATARRSFRMGMARGFTVCLRLAIMILTLT